MATQPIDAGRVAPFSGALLSMPAVALILSRYSRDQIAAFVEIAIELADTLDAPEDPDSPDFRPRSDGLPGAPDDCEPETADTESGAYAEWHTLRANQRRSGSCVIESCGNEDDEADDHPEEDDATGQCDEDGVNSGNGVPYLYGGFDYSGPGCPISDEGEPDARQLRKLRSCDDGADPDYNIDDGGGSLPVRSLRSD